MALIAGVGLAAPLEAQFPDLCAASGAQHCEYFSELRYEFRLGGQNTAADHSMAFETGVLAYPERGGGVGASAFFGADFSGDMRTGLKARAAWQVAGVRFGLGIGTILIDSRGIEPSFLADLGVSPVRFLTLRGGMELVRERGTDEPWWSIGASLQRFKTTPDRLGAIIVGAGFLATLLREAF